MNDKGIRPCGCWLWFFEDEAGGAEREVRAQLWFSQTWYRLVRKLEGGLVQIAEDMEQCVLVSNREDKRSLFVFIFYVFRHSLAKTLTLFLEKNLN